MSRHIAYRENIFSPLNITLECVKLLMGGCVLLHNCNVRYVNLLEVIAAIFH